MSTPFYCFPRDAPSTQPGLGPVWTRDGVGFKLRLAPPGSCTCMKTQVTLPSLLSYLRNLPAPQTSPRMDPAGLDLCEFTGLDGEALPSPLREATCLQGDPGEHLPSHQTKSGDDSNKHPSLWGICSHFWQLREKGEPSPPGHWLCSAREPTDKSSVEDKFLTP